MMLEIGVALTTERALRRSLHVMKPELPGVGVCELRREKRAAVILEADQPSIKQKISVGCEHEAVEAIESLMRSVADALRLDVAGPQQSGLLDSCDAANRLDLKNAPSKNSLSASRVGHLLACRFID
jgi:hypothetical protein